MYQDRQQDPSTVYFTILVVIEVVVFIFTIVTKQDSLVMFNILRIIMLAGSKCLQSTSWMVQYVIFALICALLSFDPVGLWITGRSFIIKVDGEKRNGGQNALCVIVFLCLSIAVYVGFLYKRSFEKQIDGGFSNGYTYPQQNIYRQPQQQPAPYNNRQQGRGYSEFSGQGYSLS